MADDDENLPVAATPPPAFEGLTLLDLLSRAQRALYATLLVRIESGTADKDDIKTLRQLLAENGMVLAVDAMHKKMIDITPKPIELPNYGGDRYDE